MFIYIFWYDADFYWFPHKKKEKEKKFMLIQPNLLGTNVSVQNRHVFGLNRLNKQRFPKLGLYLE